MIRTNNYGLAMEYIEHLQRCLTAVVVMQVITIMLLLGALAMRLISGVADPGLCQLGWMGLEWVTVVRLLRRKGRIKNGPSPSNIKARQWRSQTWEFLLNWRYLKFLCLILSLLSLLENREAYSPTLPTLYHRLYPLLSMIPSVLSLKLAKSMLLSLRRLNRVFNNFLSDFGEDEGCDFNHEKYPDLRMLQDIY